MKIIEKTVCCPVCGSKHFPMNSPKSRKCGDCGFEWFMNAAAACVAFIMNEHEELLSVRRKWPPAAGTLDLPGGFADVGESIEEAVTREVKEETGLVVEHTEYLFSIPNSYRYSGADIPTLDMFFGCKVKSGASPVANDDASACMWIGIKQLDSRQFGLDSIRKGVERFMKEHLL